MEQRVGGVSLPTPALDRETIDTDNAELRSQLKRKQISELKEECRAKGVKATGLKDNLIDRLVEMSKWELGNYSLSAAASAPADGTSSRHTNHLDTETSAVAE